MLVDVATAVVVVVVVDSTVVDAAAVVTDADELEPQAAIRRLVPKTKVAIRKRNL